MWSKRRLVKVFKAIKVVRTKKINGVPYKKINIYHPIALCVVVFSFSKGLFSYLKHELKDISKEFEWKRDFLQEYEEKE